MYHEACLMFHVAELAGWRAVEIIILSYSEVLGKHGLKREEEEYHADI